jgi:ATP-dependent Zn protease
MNNSNNDENSNVEQFSTEYINDAVQKLKEEFCDIENKYAFDLIRKLIKKGNLDPYTAAVNFIYENQSESENENVVQKKELSSFFFFYVIWMLLFLLFHRGEKKRRNRSKRNRSKRKY